MMPQVGRMLTTKSFFCVGTVDENEQDQTGSPSSSMADEYGNAGILGVDHQRINSLKNLQTNLSNAIF